MHPTRSYCRHRKKDSGRHCRRSTRSATGFCQVHADECIDPYYSSKPDECPVCLESLHQTRRPLECGHWVHRVCVQRGDQDECPLCRAELPTKDTTPSAPTPRQCLEIPDDLIASAASTLVAISAAIQSLSGDTRVSPSQPESRDTLATVFLTIAEDLVSQMDLPSGFNAGGLASAIAAQLESALENPCDYSSAWSG